jgi:RNA polymerase sigma-70 factor, ECF subfamily
MPAGRQDVFATLVMSELDVLMGVARSLTRHEGEAEDLVRETLRRAFDGIDRFQGRPPRVWLLTTMRTARSGYPRRLKPEGLEYPVAVGFSDGFDSAVYHALCDLPPRLREPVELVDLHELSYREAAAALGVPIRLMRARLYHARRRIRRALEGSGPHARRPE